MKATWSRLGSVTLLIGTLLLVTAIPSSQAHSSYPWRAEVDLAAVALGSDATPTVTETAYNEAWRPHRKVQAETSATANAGCDGCDRTATALQILYLHRPRSATLDNVSVAWSTCTDCSATAVSAQVVVMRRAHALDVNNSALALSADCEGCQTSSLAYQLVVVDPDAGRLSRGTRDELRAWVAEQVELAQNPPVAARLSTAGASGPTGALADLEALVNQDLGSTTLEADVDKGTP